MKTKSKLLKVVRDMPPLRHWPDQSRDFCILNSEIVRWLCREPDVMQWLFDTMRSRKLIEFDQRTGRWRGRP